MMVYNPGKLNAHVDLYDDVMRRLVASSVGIHGLKPWHALHSSSSSRILRTENK